MNSIIDDTISILAGMGLKANLVSSPPGFTGLQVNLPHDSQAYFVWAKLDGNDFAFRLARFWQSDSPFSMWVCPTLNDAIAKTRVLISQ